MLLFLRVRKDNGDNDSIVVDLEVNFSAFCVILSLHAVRQT